MELRKNIRLAALVLPKRLFFLPISSIKNSLIVFIILILWYLCEFFYSLHGYLHTLFI